MQEIINCPSCQRKLQVPESLIGQDVQCPTCGATFVASVGARQSGPPPYSPSSPPYSGSSGPPPLQQSSPPPRPSVRRPRDYDDYDDYDDDDDYRGSRRSRRSRRRRDLAPHRGSTILTLGILSLVTGLGIILGPMAWIMGNQDMVEIERGRMDPEGEGSTNAGRICGMISTILSGVGVLMCCLWLALVIGVGSTIR